MCPGESQPIERRTSQPPLAILVVAAKEGRIGVAEAETLALDKKEGEKKKAFF